MNIFPEKDYHWHFNQEVAKQVGLSNRAFVEKIKHLRRLYMVGISHFNIIPLNAEQWEENERLWDFVHNDQNLLNEREFSFLLGPNLVFLAEMPKWLWLFLKHSPRHAIHNPGCLWLAGGYVLFPEARSNMEHFIYRPVFEEAKQLARRYFPELIDHQVENNDKMFYLYENYFEEAFHEAFTDLVGNSIIYNKIKPDTYGSPWFEDEFEYSMYFRELVIHYGLSFLDFHQIDQAHPYDGKDVKRHDQDAAKERIRRWFIKLALLNPGLPFPADEPSWEY